MQVITPTKTVAIVLPAKEADALLGMAARTTVTLSVFDPDPEHAAALDEQWESAYAAYRACRTVYAAITASQQAEG